MSQTKAQLVSGLNLNPSAPATALQIDASGNINLDSNTLYVDATNNRVGVGTGSPGYLLTVNGRISYSGAIGEGADTTLSSTSTTVILADSATWQNLALKTNGQNRLYINSSGNVGIGTTSPDANSQLHVVGSSYQPLYINTTGTGGGGAAFLRSGTQALYVGTAGGSWLTGSSTADGLIRSEANLIFSIGNSEKTRLDSSGRLLVGTSSARSNFFGASYASALQVETASANSPNGLSIGANTNDDNPANLYLFKTRGTSVGSNTVVQSGDVIGSLNFIGADGTNVSSPAAWIRCAVDGTPGVGDMPGRLVFSTTKDGQSSPTERMRIINDGSILIQQTALSSASDGCYFNAGTPANFHQLLCHSSSTSTLANLYLNRQASDGTLIDFRQADTSEGVISVSGTTVSLVGGHIARWSQLPNNGDPSELLKGTVMSNLDEMCEWGEEDNEQLNKSKVSDVEGDPHVAGVFVSTAFSDEGPLDFYLAMTGDMIIRIAEGVTVQRGDLLMSAGDGTAKPQDDDIVRSKTVAKVTSTHVTCTYDDGSYCVPCVLMAC
jgi:hypothetical protein